MAAEHEEPFFASEFFDERLCERFALRREIDSAGFVGLVAFDGLHGVPHGLAHHDHAGAAAEGAVVGFAVRVVGEGADVGCDDFKFSGVDCSLGNAHAEDGGGLGREHFGECGEGVDAHAPE